MDNIRFYLYNGISPRVELNNVTLPNQHTDVMDGTWDAGSFEFIINLEDCNNYIEQGYLREGEFIEREIISNGQVIEKDGYMIDELSTEKDSIYSEDAIKVTIRYVEKTKYLTTFLMPNFTHTVKPPEATKGIYTDNNTLLDQLNRVMAIMYERNERNRDNPNVYKRGFSSISSEVLDILGKYPDYTATYLDKNLYDIILEIFTKFSAVPYVNSDNELTLISSMGRETNKVIDYNECSFMVSSSYNRSLSDNCDAIESKVENVVCENDPIGYPYNEIVLATRPRGLNEGLEEYQDWQGWYLDLQHGIDSILQLRAYDNPSPNSDGLTHYKDITEYIVEKTIWDALTSTEKKYYAYFKRGDSRIYNIMQTIVTREDDIWPWDRIGDNKEAFRTSFNVKYTPIMGVEVLVVKNKNHLLNKRNIVIDEKNTSDSSIMSRLGYEMAKRYYSEYMIEIAGEYQNIMAGDLVDITSFEKYLIPSNKYLIYKVDTTIEKGGCHQLIYFNEVIAKNNVLLNEDNLIRITQNPSTDTLVNRTYKKTDILGIKFENVSSDDVDICPSINNAYMKNKFLFNCLERLFGASQSRQYPLKNIVMKIDLNNKSEYINMNFTYFNAGTVSQAICRMKDNIVIDYFGSQIGPIAAGNTAEDGYYYKFVASRPVLYTNTWGIFKNLKFVILYEHPMMLYPPIHEDTFYGSSYPYLDEKNEDNAREFFDVVSSNDYDYNMLNSPMDLPSLIKDTRDVLNIVYEQTFYSDDNNLLLSDYFTNTSTNFEPMSLLSTHSNYKDILIFDKKLYNPNIVNESDAAFKIDNANNTITSDSTLNCLKIDLSSLGLINGNDYTFVLRGTNRTYRDNNGNEIKQMVPQLIYRFKYYDNKSIIKISLTSDL